MCITHDVALLQVLRVRSKLFDLGFRVLNVNIHASRMTLGPCIIQSLLHHVIVQCFTHITAQVPARPSAPLTGQDIAPEDRADQWYMCVCISVPCMYAGSKFLNMASDYYQSDN
jgi:hypothetical protein